MNAHSYGGKLLSVRASEEEIKRHRMGLWHDHWDEEERRFVEEEANKVLLPMEPSAYCDDETGNLAPLLPIVRDRIKPLISFWFPVHSEGLGDVLFLKAFPAGPINGFPGVFVFSMSNYLRTKMVWGRQDCGSDAHDGTAHRVVESDVL